MDDKYKNAQMALEAALYGLNKGANELCEELRMRDLHSLGIMDTLSEADFDDLVKLAALVSETPYSFISFLDTDRAWIKSTCGGELFGANHKRSDVICDLVVKHPDTPIVINDAQQDARVATKKFVMSGNIGSYLGVPVISRNGNPIGTVCGIGPDATLFTHNHIDGLIMVSRLVTSLLYKR